MVATPAFDLPARWVFHAIGPVWRGGAHGEDALLAACYQRALALATVLGAQSVSFPAISTGVFGFPAARAAAIAIRAIRAAQANADGPERVLLVAFDEAMRAVLAQALEEAL